MGNKGKEGKPVEEAIGSCCRRWLWAQSQAAWDGPGLLLVIRVSSCYKTWPPSAGGQDRLVPLAPLCVTASNREGILRAKAAASLPSSKCHASSSFGQLSPAAIQEGDSGSAVSSLTKLAIKQLSGVCFEKFVELQTPDVLCELPSEGYFTLQKKLIHSKGSQTLAGQ